MTITELIKRDSRYRQPPGYGLCECRLCGKRGTGRVVRRHVMDQHLGEQGIGMPKSESDRAMVKILKERQTREKIAHGTN